MNDLCCMDCYLLTLLTYMDNAHKNISLNEPGLSSVFSSYTYDQCHIQFFLFAALGLFTDAFMLLLSGLLVSVCVFLGLLLSSSLSKFMSLCHLKPRGSVCALYVVIPSSPLTFKMKMIVQLSLLPVTYSCTFLFTYMYSILYVPTGGCWNCHYVWTNVNDHRNVSLHLGWLIWSAIG